jgi:competence protein ComEA
MKSLPSVSHPAYLIIACLLTLFCRAAEPLQEFKECKLIPTEWADGDSFEVKFPDGENRTIRLYGADCFEWHVNDDSDSRRLREQRRYFGIAEFGNSPQTSINAAKDLGRKAAAETNRLLARPFTIHTAMANALGDGKHPRIYGFVTTADGKDLAESLVRAGLARAFGVYRETPQGASAKESKEYLRDVELTAAKSGAGAWGKTDWYRLPAERRQQRDEDAELELATGVAKSTEPFQLDPNTAARDELIKIPGIGEATANRIIEERPYKTISDLDRVSGIGPKTLEKFAPFLKLPASK